MNKKPMYQAIALTSILMALASCTRREKPPQGPCPPKDQSVAGQIRSDCLKTDQKMQLLASKIDDIQKQICCLGMETVHECWGGKVPAHYDNDRFFITGEFLYWKADEDGLEYGTKVQGLTVSKITSGIGNAGGNYPNTNSTVEDLSFSWNPGFRLGAGGTFGDHDHWDLFLNYTRINNKAHGSASIGASQGVILPAWDGFILGVASNNASAHLHVNLNTLDLELGRDYFVAQDLAIRPHLGLRGAIIDQAYNASYNPAIGSITSTLSMKNDFMGIGVRAGSDMMWHFCQNFGIYGQISGALLYGRFKVYEKFKGAFPTPSLEGSYGVTTKLNEDFSRTRANIQAAIGFTWEEVIALGDYKLAISLGYEMSEWFDQNQMMQKMEQLFPNGSGNTTLPAAFLKHQDGDLGFQGGSLKFMIDF